MTLKGDTKFKGKLTPGLKNYRRVIFHGIEKWCKVWSKTEFWFQKCRKLVNFNVSSNKSENLHFGVLLLWIAYKVLAKKVQKSYHSWHWRLIQTLKKNWLFVWKITWGIWWSLTWAVEVVIVCIFFSNLSHN